MRLQQQPLATLQIPAAHGPTNGQLVSTSHDPPHTTQECKPGTQPHHRVRGETPGYPTAAPTRSTARAPGLRPGAGLPHRAGHRGDPLARHREGADRSGLVDHRDRRRQRFGRRDGGLRQQRCRVRAGTRPTVRRHHPWRGHPWLCAAVLQADPHAGHEPVPGGRCLLLADAGEDARPCRLQEVGQPGALPGYGHLREEPLHGGGLVVRRQPQGRLPQHVDQTSCRRPRRHHRL